MVYKLSPSQGAHFILKGDSMDNTESCASLTEHKLLAIWSEVLGPHEVGLSDNFIDLGGDSLSAMLCISRVRREFGIELDIEDFFLDAVTVKSLGELIDAKMSLISDPKM